MNLIKTIKTRSFNWVKFWTFPSPWRPKEHGNGTLSVREGCKYVLIPWDDRIGQAGLGLWSFLANEFDKNHQNLVVHFEFFPLPYAQKNTETGLIPSEKDAIVFLYLGTIESDKWGSGFGPLWPMNSIKTIKTRSFNWSKFWTFPSPWRPFEHGDGTPPAREGCKYVLIPWDDRIGQAGLGLWSFLADEFDNNHQTPVVQQEPSPWRPIEHEDGTPPVREGWKCVLIP